MFTDFYHRFAMLHQILDLRFHTLSVNIFMELCFLLFREASHVWKHHEKDDFYLIVSDNINVSSVIIKEEEGLSEESPMHFFFISLSFLLVFLSQNLIHSEILHLVCTLNTSLDEAHHKRSELSK